MSGHRSCRGATDASIDAVLLEEFQVAPGCLDSDSASDVTYGTQSARTQSVRPPGPDWGQVLVNQAGQRDKVLFLANCLVLYACISLSYVSIFHISYTRTFAYLYACNSLFMCIYIFLLICM